MTKSITNRTITGTLGAIAERMRIDYTWLRAAFIVLTLVTYGAALAAYAILWILMPGPKRPLRKTVSLGSRLAVAPHFLRDAFAVICRSPYGTLFGGLFLILGIWGLARGEGAVLPAIFLTASVPAFGGSMLAAVKTKPSGQEAKDFPPESSRVGWHTSAQNLRPN